MLLDWVGRPAAGLRLSELLSVGGRIYWETHLSPLLHMQGRVDEVAVELRGPDGRLPVLLSAVVSTGVDGERRVDVALSRAAERSRYERELLAARTAADRSADQLRALQATTAALSQGVGTDGVAGALAAAAVTHLGASAASVWVAADDGTLVRRASAGGPAPDASSDRRRSRGSVRRTSTRRKSDRRRRRAARRRGRRRRARPRPLRRARCVLVPAGRRAMTLSTSVCSPRSASRPGWRWSVRRCSTRRRPSPTSSSSRC